MTVRLLDFPDDLLLELLSWLANEPHTLVQVERTCRTLRAIVQRSLTHGTRIAMAEARHRVRDRRLVFDAKPHTYSIDASCDNTAAKVKSVTQLCRAYFPEFDGDAVLAANPDAVTRKRKWGAVTDDEIKLEWARRRDQGTALHEAIEFHLRSDGRPTTTTSSLLHASVNAEMFREALRSVEYERFLHFERVFLRDGGWCAYRVEWRLFDAELALAGTIDALFYHRERREYMLLDWKRVRAFYRKPMPGAAQRFGRDECATTPHCNVGHYTLQLNVYAWLLAHCYGIDVGERMALVRFHGNNFAEIEWVKCTAETVTRVLGRRRREVSE